MSDTTPSTGLYEQLVTETTEAWLAGANSRDEPVDDADQALLLGEYVGRAATKAWAGLSPEQRVTEANRVLALVEGGAAIVPGPKQLWVVDRGENPGDWQRLQTRPEVPLSRPALLTNARADPKLGAELRAELATADRVDLLCAFVKWYGLRVLDAELLALKARKAPLRVLTTTYMGATDRTALDRLVNDFGAEVKINYETMSTRLHAKAWLFRRNTGFDTAYVGSSNLSKAALLDGLEWNVRLAGAHTPELLAKFEGTFDSYWADPAFITYDPAVDGPRLDESLAVAAGHQTRDTVTFTVSGLQVRPYPHQQEILDRLDVERTVHDRHRNLVVAATGTGKTVVAALDYARQPGLPSLLFVAHRKELLDQSRRTFREVLGDGSFGERYVDGETPTAWRHVFASVQSLSAYGVERLPADQFDIVVIDEFHHAQAATYRKLLDHLQPKELLGLTATPERTDGIDVRSFFGGRAAAELRLWDALENDLLCPFHYFGVSDGTDLSQLTWRRGDYDSADLEHVYTADDARVRIVLRALRDKVDVNSMRALGFCVSVGHAHFMASRFNQAGIPALAVSGATPGQERVAALHALRTGQVKVLFAVDLFNEGLDLPDVDTLLLLRPTQSATVFLQQLGRGLRRTPTKPVLTVLEFIGQQGQDFRFDLKYRALTGATRAGLQSQVEHGFAYLPSGCELVLDRVAQAVVLENVKRQLTLSRKQLLAEVRSHGDRDLAGWLSESGRELADVYRRNGSWTALRREAGHPTPEAGPQETQLLKRMAAFSHVDDAERAAAYTRFVTEPTTYTDLDDRSQRLARMMFFSMWPDGGDLPGYQAGFDLLAANPAVRDEIRQLVALGLENAAHVALRLESGLQQVTLQAHAHYSRDEILAGLDWAAMDGLNPRKTKGHASGVLWAEESKTDALLITLVKNEKHFSPDTRYHDYALSADQFHWESQNSTTTASRTGRRYLGLDETDSHVLLFARQNRSTGWGDAGAPYLCLGPASYVAHQGERPIAITWALRHPMPVETFRQASLVG
jgi:superfamily II DNA or RNA helicase/HKD family nuclease